MACRYLDSATGVASRMLDERDQAGRHEPPSSNRDARPGDLADLDHAPTGDHLDPAPRSGRRDLERLDTLAGVDDSLDAIAFHPRSLAVASSVGSPRRGRLSHRAPQRWLSRDRR
jgi:hypothetical protein